MRKLATFCLAFALGAFSAQYLLDPGQMLWLGGGAAALFLLALVLLRGSVRLRAALIAAGLALSLLWCWLHTTYVFAPFESLIGTTETRLLELTDYAVPTEYGAKVEVRLPDSGLRGRAMYYGDDALLDLAPGTRLSARCFANSAAQVRDEEITTFTSRGVFLLLYDRGEAEVLPSGGVPLRYLPQRLARRAQGVITDVFPQRTQPFLRAILLGDRTWLSEEDGVFLSEAGLYHVTAVSGLHCAFLLSLLGFLLGQHRRTLLSAVAIPVLAFYALMVGATPSVLRACIMLTLVLLAPLAGRESDGLTSLSLALLLILLHNPYAAASVSLQLSFASMAGLLTLTPRIYARMARRRRPFWQRFVLGSLAATAGALLFTAPLTAYYFNYLPLIAPLSNLLCLWAASLVFASGFLVVALGFFLPAAARFFAYLPHGGALYLLGIARLLTAVPYHAVYFTNSFLKFWLVYVYTMLAACVIVRCGRGRYLTFGVLSAATLALTVWLNMLPMAHGALHAIALDVGQGQSIVLHSKGRTALIDCGSSNSFLAAGDIAADYLESIGCRSIDYLVLTHYHSDHCDGLPVLLARLKVKELLLPDIEPDDVYRGMVLELAARYRIPVRYVRTLERLPLGEAQLTLYPPLTDGEMNEECLSALCTAGSFDVLVTGDMDANTEYLLISRYRLPDIEALIAGHHGSRYSTGEDLLAETRPEIAIVSCGSNSYGHPHDATLRRLTRANVAVYRTDVQGDVHITVN